MAQTQKQESSMHSFGHTRLNTTRDGVQVATGQCWQSMDKRRPARSCKVTNVEEGVATLQEYERDRDSAGLVAARQSPDPKVAAYAAAWKPEAVRVHVHRMHTHSTGWRLLP